MSQTGERINEDSAGKTMDEPAEIRSSPTVPVLSLKYMEVTIELPGSEIWADIGFEPNLLRMDPSDEPPPWRRRRH
jgi:hypothetical protein